MAQHMLQGPGWSPSTTGLDVADVKVDALQKRHISSASPKRQFGVRIRLLLTLKIDVNSRGKRTMSPANLQVRVVPEQRWIDHWKRNTRLCMKALNQGVHGGNSHRIKRRMVYKLLGTVVEYSKEFQGMEEVVLDCERREAVSTVNFQIAQGGFVVNLRWIGGIAGFIMNGNDAVESKKQVFINNG
jgi:naphtho-gamma-pyrone polyketide synthase